jgi:hypothetical protein
MIRWWRKVQKGASVGVVGEVQIAVEMAVGT